MKRKTFTMPKELDQALSEAAEEEYTSEASIVRRAVSKEVMQ